MIQASSITPDFLVSTSSAADGSIPVVASLADGTVVVAWKSREPDGTYDIRARILSPDGTATAPDFLINDATTLYNGDPVVEPFGDGFVVLWQQSIEIGHNDVVMRLFDQTGAPVGATTGLGSVADKSKGNIDVETIHDGRVLVTWSAGGYGDDYDVYGRYINVDGTPDPVTFAITSSSTRDELFPDITELQDGRRVFAWQSLDASYNADVSARISDAGGTTLGIEFSVNTTTRDFQGVPSVIALDDGFSIAWRHGNGDGTQSYRAQEFDSAGAKVGGEKIVLPEISNAHQAPLVLDLANGQLAVLYEAHDQANFTSSIFLRVFDKSWNAISGEIKVNSSEGSFAGYPQLDVTPDGRIVVAWATNGGIRAASVTLVDEPNSSPSNIILSANSVIENAASGTVVGILTAIDSDPNDSHTFVLRDDADGRFVLSGDRLVVADGLVIDFEQAASHMVTVRVRDQAGGFIDRSLTIAVSDVSPETVTGDDRNNMIVGGAGDDSIAGGGGDDVIDGGAGNDTLDGGYGSNLVAGGEGNDRIIGGIPTPSATEQLYGNAGDDTFELSFAGAGSINGGDGHDTVLATASGALGTFSFANVEELQVGFTGMQLFASISQLRAFSQIMPSAGSGSVAIWLNGSTDGTVLDLSESITGGVDVALNGSDLSGSVAVKTGIGDDELMGSNSNDLLQGGAGSDTLDGGDGFDTAKFDGEFGNYRFERVDEPTSQAYWLVTSPDSVDVLRNMEWLAFKTIGDLLVADFIGALDDVDPAEIVVAENAARGSLAGLTFQAADGNGDAVSYSLIENADGVFAIDASTGLVSVVGPFDYETASSLQIVVRATSADGSFTRKAVVIEIADVNEAPTDIAISSSTIRELSIEGGVVGTLTASDFDLTDTHTFTLRNNAGGRFKIDGNKLVVAERNMLDFEQAASHQVIVRATDQGGKFVDKTFTIAVNDIATETVNGDYRADKIAGGNNADELSGGGGNDTIWGGGGGDRIYGGEGADSLFGGTGDDKIDGGAGADTMTGGAGNDSYFVTEGDVIVETEKSGTQDRVFAAALSIDLSKISGGHVEHATLLGSLALSITGTASNNKLKGNDFANTLNGKLGTDLLSGGSGRDKFVFDTKLGANNVDRITDFAKGDDRICLDNAILTKLGAAGGLKAAFFQVGRADDKDDFILYDTATGALFYDADGSGAGAGIKFAVIEAKPTLSAADFLVI